MTPLNLWGPERTVVVEGNALVEKGDDKTTGVDSIEKPYTSQLRVILMLEMGLIYLCPSSYHDNCKFDHL